jgi:hypothetical protein
LLLKDGKYPNGVLEHNQKNIDLKPDCSYEGMERPCRVMEKEWIERGRDTPRKPDEDLKKYSKGYVKHGMYWAPSDKSGIPKNMPPPPKEPPIVSLSLVIFFYALRCQYPIFLLLFTATLFLPTDSFDVWLWPNVEAGRSCRITSISYSG